MVEFDSPLALAAKLEADSRLALVAVKAGGSYLLVEPAAEGSYRLMAGLLVHNFLLLGAETMVAHNHRDPVGIHLEWAGVGHNHLGVLSC